MDLALPTPWLDFPLEIRMLVYVHYFRAKTIHLHLHCIDDWLFECWSSEDEGEVVIPGGPKLQLIHGTIPRPGHSSLRVLRAEPLALLRTSKAVRREAEPVFWKETMFEFESRSSHHINDPKFPVDIKVMHLKVYNDDSYGDTLEDWLSRRFEPSNMWMDELFITGFPFNQSTSETLLSLLFRLGTTKIGRLNFLIEAPRYPEATTANGQRVGAGTKRPFRVMLGKAKRGLIYTPTKSVADHIVKEIETVLGSKTPVELDWTQDNLGM